MVYLKLVKTKEETILISEKNTEIEYNPITDGVIWKEILVYFFPILFGTFFQQLYNTVDALIVGRFIGKEAIAAVAGSAGMVVLLVVGFFGGLSTGATVLVSQYYGALNKEKVSKTIHTVILFCFLCGIVLSIAGWILAPSILIWMKTPEDTMEMSITYLRVYSCGFFGNLVFNIGSGILRAVGDSKRPTRYLMISCILNTVFDILFVIPFQMGVFGAAAATVLAQMISACLVLHVLHDTTDCYRFEWKNLSLDSGILTDMIRIGLPAGLISVMYGFSNTIIQVGFNGISTDAVAAWAVYYKVDTVYWMGINAFGATITTFVGQNFGAGKMKRIYKSIRTTQLMSLGFSIICSFCIYVLGPRCIPFFVDDPAVIAVGTDMMHFLCVFYFIYTSIEVLSGALRGVGDTVIPMIICALGICALRSAWIIWVLPLRHDMYTLMFSYPLSWGITLAAFLIYFVFFSKLKLFGSGRILR